MWSWGSLQKKVIYFNHIVIQMIQQCIKLNLIFKLKTKETQKVPKILLKENKHIFTKTQLKSSHPRNYLDLPRTVNFWNYKKKK